MSRTNRKTAYRFYRFLKTLDKVERNRFKIYLNKTDDFETYTYSEKPQGYKYEYCRYTNEGTGRGKYKNK